MMHQSKRQPALSSAPFGQSITESGASSAAAGHEDEDYQYFMVEIKRLTGIDLLQYKEAQMKRRLITLRAKNGYKTFRSFFEAIRQNPDLLDDFLDRMTINVSEFWRNPNRWVTLRDSVLPALAANTKQLRCWSAACSTGEEPYTLAMILNELGLLQRSQITATDLDENVLVKAKEACYVERALKDVPDLYRRKYFQQGPEEYRIIESLKSAIRFRKQNLLEDEFDTSLDLIICRNVTIYFTEDAKSQVYNKFANALKPGGVLFVGSTEQIFNPGQYGLETIETFFYRKMTSSV
ncbi:CheR family methyltransferase [Paenibacillus popilliae]|uniref:protein-glutamate O-methyltransferase n=1 Tax=Paenibacillus popilliae ATCC 14706 TaxID=1212764 RepID=M9LZR3_PAEPP|nr:protein-glutamate O-methyltransferase CheR [Paenibacillus popilliae]GAC41854.1 methylase [Paenibacillus popilliae ATCC 14706]